MQVSLKKPVQHAVRRSKMFKDSLDIKGLCNLLNGGTTITVYTGCKTQNRIETKRIMVIASHYWRGSGGCSLMSNTGWFLEDAGVTTNTYNDHLTFKTREEAEEYVFGYKTCPTCGGKSLV